MGPQHRSRRKREEQTAFPLSRDKVRFEYTIVCTVGRPRPSLLSFSCLSFGGGGVDLFLGLFLVFRALCCAVLRCAVRCGAVVGRWVPLCAVRSDLSPVTALSAGVVVFATAVQ